MAPDTCRRARRYYVARLKNGVLAERGDDFRYRENYVLGTPVLHDDIIDRASNRQILRVGDNVCQHDARAGRGERVSRDFALVHCPSRISISLADTSLKQV